MSRGWKHSDLQMGEELKIPSEMIQSIEGHYRFLSARYIGETETGIRILLEFKPSISGMRCEYERFVDWAAIWCGAVIVRRHDGTKVIANRIHPHPLQRYYI